ncbi:unnamed protein product, partial [Mesorhabditis belari]|uniref:Serpentine receptor class gamma n=1 Tax=Mesorhabditis belari TaxID=2138241 RepID=A0AAF3EBZ4_9BILA
MITNFQYIITYINTYLTTKLPELSILSSIFVGIEHSFPPYRILYMYKHAGFHAENCALILMHLNRFTSVWMPITHNLIWKPRNINLAFLFIFLFANAINFQNLLVTVPIFVESGGYAVWNLAPLAEQIPFTWLMLRVAGYVYPLLSLLINIGIFAKLFILRFSGSSFTTGNTVEIHLLLICVASLCMQIGLMVFVVGDFSS